MLPEDIDAELARDADFSAICDARRAAWMESLDAELEARRRAGRPLDDDDDDNA